MELSKQVTSLELSKKLKELGVKQKSLFYWVEKENTVDGCKVSIFSKYDGDFFFVLSNESNKYECSRETGRRISAFTVAELGKMLPSETYTKREINGNLTCASTKIINAYPMPCQIAKTEADARAKMLIYLLENKLITL